MNVFVIKSQSDAAKHHSIVTTRFCKSLLIPRARCRAFVLGARRENILLFADRCRFSGAGARDADGGYC
jgi:hypothetical protein